MSIELRSLTAFSTGAIGIAAVNIHLRHGDCQANILRRRVWQHRTQPDLDLDRMAKAEVTGYPLISDTAPSFYTFNGFWRQRQRVTPTDRQAPNFRNS